LKPAADGAGIHLLGVDKYAALDGMRAWHDPALWHRSKQEIHPSAAHMYGEYLVRLVAAQRGVSSKCLVLDLDNTLWGGVIGDDGIEGIVLGQGNAVGESHVALQRYALHLRERGVILAVCSKNDEANAISAFEQHPEMILKRDDIACFVANWTDKATNLKYIAKYLNIGIDSLVFVDDNPFERNLVRQELPQVSVPELPEDPGLYVQCIAAAGYFEALTLTEEDRHRAEQYQMNAAREALRESATDMDSYLRGMAMELLWKPFDEIGLQRIVQLINKTNQFNVMTRRYSDAEIRTTMAESDVLTWQIRLRDKFGDNGIICILIARLDEKEDLLIDTWLMSCRVLGRQVEEACLNLLVEGGRRLGARRLLGEYQKTSKNAMVADLYRKLGFSQISSSTDSIDRWALDLGEFNFRETHITVLGEA
jgi:FkbH-like protein